MSKGVGLIAALCVACAASQPAVAQQAPPDNDYWWPNRLSLEPLRNASASADPMGADFRYPAAFAKLDVAALKKDLITAMKTSQDWWPADFGNYGPFFIRMSWHAAGTYRALD